MISAAVQKDLVLQPRRGLSVKNVPVVVGRKAGNVAVGMNVTAHRAVAAVRRKALPLRITNRSRRPRRLLFPKVPFPKLLRS